MPRAKKNIDVDNIPDIQPIQDPVIQVFPKNTKGKKKI